MCPQAGDGAWRIRVERGVTCRVPAHPQVNGPVAELMPESCWGLYTRAVEVEDEEEDGPGASPQQQATVGGTGAGGKGGAGRRCGVVRWGERFLVKLPVELSEQLLCPAPGDDQFSGVPLQVRGRARAVRVLHVVQLWPMYAWR